MKKMITDALVKKLEGMEVEQALAVVEAEGIEYEYEEENEVVCGSLILGHYWGDHIEFEIEDGVLLEGMEHYWD